MAVINLGLVITDIRGSIGGTTIRKGERNLIMYNKQRSQKKSAFGVNSVKNKIGVIFNSWSQVNAGEKTQWSYLASLYPQINKFGATVYLTGRQFFTKLNTQLIPTNTTVDLNNFYDTLQRAIITDVEGKFSDDEINVNFDVPADATYIYISAFQIREGSNVRPSIKKKPFYIADVNSKQTLNVFSEFESLFPFAKIGDKFCLNCQFVTFSGFKSSVQSFTITLV